MKTRTLSLFALAALGTPALAADTLLLGGADGMIYAGDPSSGGFALEVPVGGSIGAMAQMGNQLIVAESSGFLSTYGLSSGLLEGLFEVETDATDMVVHDGTLLISGSDGIIHRVNPVTGATLETFDTGFDIAALATDGDMLFAGTPFGVFHQKDLSTDSPFTFAGTCGGPINSIISRDDELYLGDTTGNVYVFDKSTTFVTYAYAVSNDATSIVADGDHFLIGGSDGTVLRVLPPFGTVVASFNVPTGVGDLFHESASSALVADRQELSLSAGGQVGFDVRVHENVPADTYFVFGTLSGKTPALDFPGFLFPLVPDTYTDITVTQANTGPFGNTFGAIDGDGNAAATLTIPGGVFGSLAGVTAHHAALAIDSGTLFIVGATNATRLDFTP